MAKHYFKIIAFFICLLGFTLSYSQIVGTKGQTSDIIQGLTIYPNPVSDGLLYIITSKNLRKQVVVFDVLGKKVMSVSGVNKTLDVSSLTSGVYILRIIEGPNTQTQKLVIR